MSIGTQKGPLIGVQKGLWLKVDAGSTRITRRQEGSFEQIKTGAAIHLALH